MKEQNQCCELCRPNTLEKKHGLDTCRVTTCGCHFSPTTQEEKKCICTRWEGTSDLQNKFYSQGGLIINKECPVHASEKSQESNCKSGPLCSHNTNGRDLSKPCSIAFPDQSILMTRKQKKEAKKSDWKESYPLSTFKGRTKEELVEFIEKIIEAARHEEHQQALNNMWIEDELIIEQHISYEAGRAAALEEVKKILENTPYQLVSPNEKDSDYGNRKRGAERFREIIFAALSSLKTE